MQYKQHDIELKSGDIILFSNAFVWYNPMRWLSWAIRKFTKAKYNHVGVVVNNWGVPFINEALVSGVVARPAQKHLHRHLTKIKVLRHRYGLIEDNFCRKANSKLGIKYDKAALVFHHSVYRITGEWNGSTGPQSEGKMVCSEYAAWCYGLNGWWALSAKELEHHPAFTVVFEE
jgi:hypothetical protein